MARIKLCNVKKSYGLLEVIHGVDLEVDDQEFVVFVGPSGCGKSTLLRMIAGLEETTQGQIWIGDRDVTQLAPVDRNVSMVFQSYALYPHMTVEKNMSFALQANGMARPEAMRRVNEAAKILHIEELLSRKPGALSGGQRQRVAIGRAIVRNPEVFLFDEPLSNLDAELRVHMRFEIERLHKRLDATMVYVTHDQTEAMTLADKIVVLRDGYIEQVGTPLELFDDPDNQFVAGFIGSPKMNFIPAIVKKRARSGVVIGIPDLADAELTMKLAAAPEPGERVVIGIRPEHFAFDRRPGAALRINCEMTEHLGDVTYIYSSFGEDEQLIVAARNDRTTTDGSLVEATIPSDRAFLFDQNQMRIR